MNKLFVNPKVGDRVVITDRLGVESIARIQKVTSRAIRVAGYNLYKFTRSGVMHKNSDDERKIKMTIKPITKHGE